MNSLSFVRRVALVIAVVTIQSLYLPTSQNSTGGIAPKLPLDIFPVYPIWVVVYVLCYPLWIFCLLWALRKMEERLFREFMTASLFTFSVGVAIFMLFPTYVDLPQISGADIFSNLLRQIQAWGGQYDALPSGHVYITTLMALFFTRWYPRTRLLWILIVILVGLSTLFTGQHYILDVLSGIGLAWLGYRFALWWVIEKTDVQAMVE